MISLTFYYLISFDVFLCQTIGLFNIYIKIKEYVI